MADHSKPTTTSTYANFVSELDARFDDLAVGLDPAVTTPTNLPTNAIRWNAGSPQKWNGSTWSDLSLDINGGTIDGTTIGATTPSTGAFTTLSSTGNTTLGDATTDAATVNGRLGVMGGNPGQGASLYVQPAPTSAAGYTQGIYITGTIQGSAASNRYDSVISIPTVDASGAVPALNHFFIQNGTFNSTVTSQYGVNVSSLSNASNNYGVYTNGVGAGATSGTHIGVRVGDVGSASTTLSAGISTAVSSGTNKWNIYAIGTANNYFAGNVGIGTTAPSATTHIANAGGTGNLLLNTTDVTSNKGGILRFGGTTTAHFASIEGGLVASASNTTGYLTINTRAATGDASLTERLRIDSSGQVGIGLTTTARNNTRLQIVDGIGFPATQVASSDANTLDDYEEGTFTPTIVGTSTAGTGTYTIQIGSYTKVGRVVYYTLNVAWTAHTGTGNIQVSGLPFTVAATAIYSPASVQQSTLVVGSGKQLSSYPLISTSTLAVNADDLAGGATAAIAMDTAATLRISGHYEV